MSLDYGVMQTALRARALTLSVATTGPTALSVTATGFARASGSFLADGFRAGMELVASGFSVDDNDGTAVVVAVSALTLTVSRALTPETSPVPHGVLEWGDPWLWTGNLVVTLSVGLPSLRAWENEAFRPTAGSPWVEEQMVPGPTTMPGLVPHGWVVGQPLYALHVYVPADMSGEAAHKYADALLALFGPGTAMTLGADEVLRVRADTGPYRGQLLPRRPGWVTVPVSFPLSFYTPN